MSSPARAVLPGSRLLVIACPLVSRAGVYSYLWSVLPGLREAGWAVGLVWGIRVPADDLPADWSHRVDEPASSYARQSRLRRCIVSSVDRWDPDVAVSMLPQSDVACAGVLPGAKVPWLAMLHGSPYPHRGEMPWPRQFLWTMAVWSAYRRANGLLAVSEPLAHEVASRLRAGPITVVGSGTPVPPSPRRVSGREPVLGFVGRLSREKGPDVFLEVARRVNAPARLFGDGPLRSIVASEASRNPLVDFRGWVDRDQALDEIDVLVMTSRREALGLAALEAGARGICVVGRDVGGIREILGRDPEVARRCLLPGDATPAAFAAALRPIIDEPGLRLELGDRLRRVVVEEFSVERHVERLTAALRRALDHCSAEPGGDRRPAAG